ncbi:MAG: trimeric intracellular cation channel family protein [Deltaproteobacteria bacterium]|nr:trimeric intracellular cation channel family protein [Deltaproteobacteria bacterium]
MAGMVAFAVTAVLAVTPKGIDLFGACVLGIITACGGGTVRDVILGVPVFWSEDQNYLWVALIASLVAFYGNRLVSRRDVYLLMLYIDGIGVSLFAIQAAHKVLALQFAVPFGPVVLGVITAIGGGLIRDVLAGNTTLLMQKELYAIPVTIGCVLYVLLFGWFPDEGNAIGIGCVLFTFAFRAAAIHWKLTVPAWMESRAKET